MAQRGKASIAHEYDKRECCIHCSMYRNNVDALVHVCKQWREDAVDKAEAEQANVTIEAYRRGQ